jgi:hypothetical protein
MITLTLLHLFFFKVKFCTLHEQYDFYRRDPAARPLDMN